MPLSDVPAQIQLEVKKQMQGYWYEQSRVSTDQDQEQAATEHGIVYFKQDGNIRIKETPVDWFTAKTEIESLRCGQYNHFIGFKNLKTRELLQFLRFELDLWYADVPIGDTVKNWDGYVWGCRIGLEAVLNVTKLFIDEVPWFDSLPFTMRKVQVK